MLGSTVLVFVTTLPSPHTNITGAPPIATMTGTPSHLHSTGEALAGDAANTENVTADTATPANRRLLSFMPSAFHHTVLIQVSHAVHEVNSTSRLSPL